MKQLLKLLFGKTAKNSYVTVGANVIHGLIVMIFFALASRSLGPEEFGLVSIALAAFAIIFDILSLGTTQALVRFVSVSLGKNKPNQAARYAGIIFKLRIIESLILVLGALYLGRELALTIYKSQQLILPLVITIASASGVLLVDFFISLLQAYEFFTKSAITLITNAVLKIILISIFIATKSINILSVTVAFVATPLLASVVGFILSPKAYLNINITSQAVKQLTRFSKWMALWGITASLAGRIDIMMLGRLSSAYETGIYSAASKLAMGFIIVGSSFASVLTPKVSRVIHQKQELKRQYILVFKIVGLIIVGMLLFAYLSRWLIPFIFGPEFIQSVLVFQSLTLGLIFFMATIPSNVNLLALGFSKWIGALAFVQLTIVVVTAWHLIPSLGAQGAAIAIIASYITAFCLSTTYAIKKIFA